MARKNMYLYTYSISTSSLRSAKVSDVLAWSQPDCYIAGSVTCAIIVLSYWLYFWLGQAAYEYSSFVVRCSVEWISSALCLIFASHYPFLSFPTSRSTSLKLGSTSYVLRACFRKVLPRPSWYSLIRSWGSSFEESVIWHCSIATVNFCSPFSSPISKR